MASACSNRGPRTSMKHGLLTGHFQVLRNWQLLRQSVSFGVFYTGFPYFLANIANMYLVFKGFPLLIRWLDWNYSLFTRCVKRTKIQLWR
jgi:hypothetical protein